VSRQRLTFRAAADDVPRAEALLDLAGAESISLHDAADDPAVKAIVLRLDSPAALRWPRT